VVRGDFMEGTLFPRAQSRFSIMIYHYNTQVPESSGFFEVNKLNARCSTTSTKALDGHWIIAIPFIILRPNLDSICLRTDDKEIKK
jgi:hypothetical protein